MHAQVDSSRYWFNYRHAVNVLSMYHAVRDLGIPDERIIVMLAEVLIFDPILPSSAPGCVRVDHESGFH